MTAPAPDPRPLDAAVRELLRAARLPETPENIAKVVMAMDNRMPERAGQ